MINTFGLWKSNGNKNWKLQEYKDGSAKKYGNKIARDHKSASLQFFMSGKTVIVHFICQIMYTVCQ